MKVQKFVDEIREHLPTFLENMKQLKLGEKNLTVDEWYEMFGRWCEIGTDMQKEYWDDQDDESQGA